MTPDEWRDLDPRDALFLWTAYNEANSRQNAANKKAAAKARMKR